MSTSINNFIIKTLLRSKYSIAILLLGLICIILTIYKYKNLLLILSEIVVFIYLAITINCSIYGECFMTPIFYLILVIMLTLFLIFDFLGIFYYYNNTIKTLYKAFETSNNTHMKHILFPDESDINPSFKNRKLPTILNEYYYNYKDKTKLQYKDTFNDK